MAFDESLANRVRRVLVRHRGVTEKRMFGGLAFLLNGNMCCGVHQDDLILRLHPGAEDQALAEPGARPMDFTGRPMKGWVMVVASALEDEGVLACWVRKAVQFASDLPPK